MANRLLMHDLFLAAPVKETCEWFGTKWEGEGKDTRLMPCGEPTVGNGLFCDPTHRFCNIMSVCERHKQPVTDWETEIG